MKIILLRHEERYELPLFFTSLTEKGIMNSKNLSNKINKINPNVIYCSPFLRTIQTIKPYCLDYNKKIPPNDEFSGSVILKKDAMDIKKKDINLVMKNLKSVAKQNGINLYIMKYVPDRNEPFIEFKMRMK